jgi:hypothetical protein
LTTFSKFRIFDHTLLPEFYIRKEINPLNISTMQNRLSLWSLDIEDDLGVYAGLIKSEMMWLFNSKLPQDILFIPYAYDGNYYSTYIQNIKHLFATFRVDVKLITDVADPSLAIKAASGIMVGGGGSLEKLLLGIDRYKTDLLKAISSGKPYLGWNEGAVLPSPSYVEPALLATGSKCLGATSIQFYPEYIDSDLKRFDILNFLLNHKIDIPPIKKVKCLSSQPGGGGVRLEDDIISIDFAGGSPAVPNILFTQSSGQLIAS